MMPIFLKNFLREYLKSLAESPTDLAFSLNAMTLDSTSQIYFQLRIPLRWLERIYKISQHGKSAFTSIHLIACIQLSHVMAATISFVEKILTGNLSMPNCKTVPIFERATRQLLGKRYQDLLASDWQEALDSVYPISLIFDIPLWHYLRRYPLFCIDIAMRGYRVQKQHIRVFSSLIDTDPYPKYYLQNFHYQTDGYLSETSAELYDLQVDIVFAGLTDAMRRRILCPLKHHLTDKATISSTQILDIACGTGRTLRQLRATFPDVQLHGIDLSPPYLRKAHKLLCRESGAMPVLTQAKAEAMPYASSTFDAISCVFLLHELPGPVRQQVIREANRVLKPGGIFVICDSMQMADSPELLSIMEYFSQEVHEPYYRDYIRDDIKKRLQKDGFELLEEKTYLFSHYFTARKLI